MAMMWHLVDHWSDQPPSFELYGDDPTWPAVIISTLEPIVRRHGIPPAAQGQLGCAVVWCSPVEQIQVRDQDIEDSDSGCTDLWIQVNPENETISLHIEGIDLLQHVRGEGSAFDHPQPLPLAGGLEESLTMTGGHLDSLCSAVVITPTE